MTERPTGDHGTVIIDDGGSLRIKRDYPLNGLTQQAATHAIPGLHFDGVAINDYTDGESDVERMVFETDNANVWLEVAQNGAGVVIRASQPMVQKSASPFVYSIDGDHKFKKLGGKKKTSGNPINKNLKQNSESAFRLEHNATVPSSTERLDGGVSLLNYHGTVIIDDYGSLVFRHRHPSSELMDGLTHVARGHFIESVTLRLYNHNNHLIEEMGPIEVPNSVEVWHQSQSHGNSRIHIESVDGSVLVSAQPAMEKGQATSSHPYTYIIKHPGNISSIRVNGVEPYEVAFAHARIELRIV